jgi:hypothetical protein
MWHTIRVPWVAYFHPKFKAEFDELAGVVQDELLAALVPLRAYGPSLGRPEVDTLNDSKYANMKEFRFRADGGVWRVAFAFDPQRNAILLVAGDKSGVGATGDSLICGVFRRQKSENWTFSSFAIGIAVF